MHNFIKCTFVFLICFVISSCVKGDKTSYEIKNIEQETESYAINGENIIIDGETDGIAKLNSETEAQTNEWIRDFESKVNSLSKKGDTPPCLQIRQMVKLDGENVFSFVTEKYAYVSGLHGNSWWSSKTYDKRMDKTLILSEIFTDSDYKKILNERINELIRNNPDEYNDLWEEPCVTSEENFYFDKDNLVIFFEPYDLSYYARGVVVFPIPIEKIRGYIKEEYLTCNL